MEPWEIKSDDKREANSRKLFIIFCEDGAIEPTYFDFFKKDNLQISTIGNSKQHHAQVDFATEYFRKNDLIEIDAKGRELLKIDDGAQVWCVFDRDREPNDGKDTAFNDSIITANLKNIKTAWSNDDFELWILLHFEDVNPNNKEYESRTKYYERLTEILKDKQPNELIFKNLKFDYYTAMKSKKRFSMFTYPLMKANVKTAIKRAEVLEQFHSNPVKPTHLHCPCTMVHHLVKELLSS